ncbi:MAG: hypothetical protein AVDCRST_MAG73-2480, partial [uncultured Thermomicrobiales bacterium]
GDRTEGHEDQPGDPGDRPGQGPPPGRAQV